MKWDEQVAAMRRFVDTEHFRYRRREVGEVGAGEIALPGVCRLAMEVPSDPLTNCLVEDFTSFMQRCMGIACSAASESTMTVRWRLVEGRDVGNRFDRQNPDVESFTIDVGDHELRLEASHPRGLVQGTHYLERLMADRGAPVLTRGRVERTPTFTPRITNSIFIDSDQDVTDPTQFSDAYLGLMSHFGANGIHLFADLWEVCRTERIPELDSLDFDEKVNNLQALCTRANAHGIDVYLCVVMKLLPAEHPAFLAHPKVRGAASELMIANVDQHCLCSGSEEVLSFYDEVLFNLFSSLPDVAGMICLVGGEGFFHCFTRPSGDFSGATSCPNCRDRDASVEVARLVNRAAAAVKRSGGHKSFYAWPYSAFVWSGSEDRTQGAWMEQLSEDVSVIANFATGSPDEVNDDGVYLWDYNIKTIGSSGVFATQREQLQARGRPIYAKVETCTTPLFFGMPYIPVHQRWFGRWKAMAAEPVAGFIGQWRFYGMNGSPPEEIQYQAAWNPQRSVDEVLRTIAARDFGLGKPQAGRVVEAWSSLSRAWDDMPFSALLAGERAFYMRGPLYLGPAHPLIFNSQNDYGLGSKFRTLRGDAREGLSPEDQARMETASPPRYVDQLLFVMPFGEERFLELIGLCRARWEAGLVILREVLAPCAEPRARMELDVCEMTGIHLATVENVTRFYTVRDQLWRRRQDRDGFSQGVEDLRRIAEAEMANANRALPMLGRDPRLAFNFCYGNPYDAGMVEAKLEQCRQFLEDELPQFDREMRFHLWMEFP